MFVLKFMFEWANINSCVWTVNQEASDKFGGYIVDHDKLDISKELDTKLKVLCAEFQSGLDWDNPAGSSLWTEDHWHDFMTRSQEAYNLLKCELGENYILEDWTDRSTPIAFSI